MGFGAGVQSSSSSGRSQQKSATEARYVASPLEGKAFQRMDAAATRLGAMGGPTARQLELSEAEKANMLASGSAQTGNVLTGMMSALGQGGGMNYGQQRDLMRNSWQQIGNTGLQVSGLAGKARRDALLGAHQARLAPMDAFSRLTGAMGTFRGGIGSRGFSEGSSSQESSSFGLRARAGM